MHIWGEQKVKWLWPTQSLPSIRIIQRVFKVKSVIRSDLEVGTEAWIDFQPRLLLLFWLLCVETDFQSWNSMPPRTLRLCEVTASGHSHGSVRVRHVVPLLTTGPGHVWDHARLAARVALAAWAESTEPVLSPAQQCAVSLLQPVMTHLVFPHLLRHWGRRCTMRINLHSPPANTGQRGRRAFEHRLLYQTQSPQDVRHRVP